MMQKMLTYGLFVVIAFLGYVDLVVAADGRKIFEENCAGCHSLGSEQSVGPGLKDVVRRRGREWLLHYIREPGEVRRLKDPIALELKKKFKDNEMPELGLSRDDVGAVVEFLDKGNSRVALVPVATIPVGDAARGRSIFMGMTRLKNGGPSCVSCHLSGGGSLGPDLTNVISKMNVTGVMAALRGISFPTMKPIYRNSPLIDEEISDLLAYFEQTSKSADGQTMSGYRFAVWASGVCVALLVLFNFIWRRRRVRASKGGA